MKQILIWALAAALILSCFGCKSAANDNKTIEQTVGGWTIAESTDVTNELREMLEKGLNGLVGASYEPIAYLGSQLVAGTNRCLLCTVTPVVPNATPHYALVFLYENLSGEVTLMNVADLNTTELITGVSTDSDKPIPAGWNEWDYSEEDLSEQAKALLDKAVAEKEGLSCEPIALLATQIVAGMNRCYLCRCTADGKTYYALVTVYEDLQGNAELLDIKPFDFAEYCTYGA